MIEFAKGLARSATFAAVAVAIGACAAQPVRPTPRADPVAAGQPTLLLEHVDEAGPYVGLRQTAFRLDERTLYAAESAGGWPRNVPHQVYSGAVRAGVHIVWTLVRFAGLAVDGDEALVRYTFRLRAWQRFRVPPGCSVAIRSRTYEIDVSQRPVNERLALRFAIRLFDPPGAPQDLGCAARDPFEGVPTGHTADGLPAPP